MADKLRVDRSSLVAEIHTYGQLMDKRAMGYVGYRARIVFAEMGLLKFVRANLSKFLLRALLTDGCLPPQGGGNRSRKESGGIRSEA